MNRQVGQRGFTIVELLIASAVFSVILLICAVGLLQIGRTYYKGVTSSQTQEAARSIIEEVSKTIQFNGGNVGLMIHPGGSEPSENPSTPSYVCIGNRRFAFVINRQLTPSGAPGPDQSRHVLAVDNRQCVGGTPQPLTNSNLLDESKELLPPNMRLTKFEVGCAPDNSTPDPLDCLSDNLYQVTVRVVAGGQDVLVDTNSSRPGPDLPGECLPNSIGGQFCAVAELSTAVQKRVK